MPARARTDGAERDGSGREPWHAKLRLEPLKDWITLGEAEEMLGISREAVHRLVQRGTLNARTIGRRPIIVVHVRSVAALPVSPQRRRELEKRMSAEAELGDELPGG